MHVVARVADRGHDVRGVEIEDIDGGGHSGERIDWERSKQGNGDTSAIRRSLAIDPHPASPLQIPPPPTPLPFYCSEKFPSPGLERSPADKDTT
jgi:hypothetical protein